LLAPKLHSVLNDENIKEFVYGGKGVGSQGDGSVQFIAKNKECQGKLVNYLNEMGLSAHPFVIPASGAVRKAIIPLAGFGTRMYPATRFCKKEFLPVVDENGIAKPVIMYLLEELEDAAIEEIILIVGEEETERFKEMFGEPIGDEYQTKLPGRVLEYERLIAKIGKKIKFAVQEERRGFGHAVYQARKFLNNEPVLLLLGDFIYKSDTNQTCTRQTINAYRKSGGQLTVAVKEIPLEDVVHYGILTGTFDGELMNVNEMVEKPTAERARDYLCSKYKNKDCYYATFGQYVLTPKVFEELEADIEKHDASGDRTEIQLTDALIKTLETDGMTGVFIDGKSYDVGIPRAYVRTVREFGG
jgi:UTP-glucose-1-phosphate uridylyltransferase